MVSQFPSPGAGTQGALVALCALRGHAGAGLGRAGHGGTAEPGAALVQEAGGKRLGFEPISGEIGKSITVNYTVDILCSILYYIILCS